MLLAFGFVITELSAMEQRYQAVLEVSAGGSPSEVAERFGVSRQTVHRWLVRYQSGGLEGLADRSKRPKSSPWQVVPEIEARVCQMRREHPRWGPRRIRAELVRAGVAPVPHRSSIYRILVRFDLLTVTPRKRRRKDYKRWQREESMQLWQMDIVGSCFLADGREVKVVTGVDDHSRYCVIAAVVPRATGRAVCLAFVAALSRFGCPDEVLTDNGKQFTGRFSRPRPAEVLFEKICRRNGITTILTKPRTPTTTGKVERFHQTLQNDCLTPLGPFATLAAAQQAVDAFVQQYNNDRPHQSLDDAVPASRFHPRPAVEGTLSLDVPAELRPGRGPVEPVSEQMPEPVTCADTRQGQNAAAVAGRGLLTEPEHWLGGDAIELDRVVPASGNLSVGNQQFWLGPANAGKALSLWMDTITVHVTLEGQLVKTLPSRQTPISLARLREQDARPAGPPPHRGVPVAGMAPGTVVEVDRVVGASGTIGLVGRVISVGQDLAGQRITLRLVDQVAHVITDGVLVRTIASPVPPERRGRLWGARLIQPGSPDSVLPSRCDLRIQRRVSPGGTTRVAGQVLRLGEAHACTIVDITVTETTFDIHDLDGEPVATVPRVGLEPVTRFKANGWRTKSS